MLTKSIPYLILEINMKIMITGHRPNKLGGYDPENPTALHVKDQIRSTLQNLVDNHGKDIELITGMAQGTDQWYATIGMEEFKLDVHAYIPFDGQESRWPDHAKRIYRYILSECKTVSIISDKPSRNAFLKRNTEMVNDCDLAIAVWNGDLKSGTGSTVQKLRKAGKLVIVIDPNN